MDTGQLLRGGEVSCPLQSYRHNTPESAILEKIRIFRGTSFKGPLCGATHVYLQIELTRNKPNTPKEPTNGPTNQTSPTQLKPNQTNKQHTNTNNRKTLRLWLICRQPDPPFTALVRILADRRGAGCLCRFRFSWNPKQSPALRPHQHSNSWGAVPGAILATKQFVGGTDPFLCSFRRIVCGSGPLLGDCRPERATAQRPGLECANKTTQTQDRGFPMPFSLPCCPSMSSPSNCEAQLPAHHTVRPTAERVMCNTQVRPVQPPLFNPKQHTCGTKVN